MITADVLALASTFIIYDFIAAENTPECNTEIYARRPGDI